MAVQREPTLLDVDAAHPPEEALVAALSASSWSVPNCDPVQVAQLTWTSELP